MRQIVGSIKEESVRYHYDQDMRERLNGYFSSGSNAKQNNYGSRTNKSGNRYQGNFGNQKQVSAGGRKFSASPSLLSSKLVKKGHTGMPLREAAIMGGLVFHPALGVEFFEEVSALELQSGDAKTLQTLFLDCFASWEGDGDFPDLDFVMERVREKGLGALLENVKQHLVINNLWQLLPNAGFEDARDGWLQSHVLYLKNQTLNKELKVAERALAEDDSQENLERLLQIQQELSRSDGIEALIDGFGASSGRSGKGF
jgi:DNA primase